MVNPDTVNAQVEGSIVFGLTCRAVGRDQPAGRPRAADELRHVPPAAHERRCRASTSTSSIQPKPPAASASRPSALVAPAVCERHLRGDRASACARCPFASSARLSEPFQETRLTSNADLHARRMAAIPRGVTNSLAVYADARLERRAVGRGRQALHRLRERHLRAQHGARASEGEGGGGAAAREAHARLLPGDAVRELHRARRAAERARCPARGRRRRSSSPPAPRRWRTPSRSRASTRSARRSSRSAAASTAARSRASASPARCSRTRRASGRCCRRSIHLPYPDGLSRRHGGGLARCARRSCSRRTWIPRGSRPSSSSRCWAKAGSTPRRRSCCASCARCATSTASCSSPMRSRRASAAPARCSPSSTPASSRTS